MIRKSGIMISTVLVVLIISGCTSLPTNQNSPTPETSPTPIETPTEQETAKTPPNHMTIDPEERLVIVKNFNENITVSMYEFTGTPTPNSTSTATPREEKIATTTFSANQTGEVRITEFEPDGYITVSTEDGVIWQHLIEPWEHYKIVIDERGEAELVETAVV